MKLIQKFWCMILGTLLMLMPFINVHASTLIERLEAVESEFGVSAEGNLSERVASLEEMLGIVPSPGSTTSERIAALEKDAGLSTEEKYAHEELKTPLSSLEPFTCSYITTNLSSTKCEDKYNNIYNSTLFADASLGFGDNVAEYLLSKEYKELHGVFYIPKKLSSFVEEKDLLMVKVKIYGDDRLLYTMPGMRMKDEPLSFNVNVSGVQFLKIEFEHAVDISGPYVVMGDAELVQ